MALSAGSVTAASDGTPSGSGLALALYQQRKTPIDANLAAAIAAGTVIPGSFWTGLADQCNADATAIVTYFTANGTAKVGAAVGSLQKTPNPNNADTLTTANGTDRFLPIV